MGKYIIELESGTHIFVLGPEGIVHIGEPDVVYETVDGMQIGDAVINAKPYTEPDLEQVRADAYNDGYKSGREAEKVRQPDLEQVKADAYLKGLNDGQGVILESTQNNAFNNGYKKCLEDMKHDKGKENSIGYKIGYKKGYIDGLNRISDYEDKIRKEAYEKGLSDAWEAARKICTNWVLPDSVLSEIFGMDKTIDDIMKENTASEAIEKIRQYEQEKEEIEVGDEVENTQTGVKFIVTHIWFNNHGEKGVSGFNHNCSAFSTTIELVKKTGRHFPEIAAVLEKMRGEQDG